MYLVPLIFDNDYNFADPNIKDLRNQIYSDFELKRQILLLKQKFLTQSDSMIHGDLHTGSLMLDSNNIIKIIDSEFFMFGPIAFDLGVFTAHLIISYVAKSNNKNLKTESDWHLSTIIDTFKIFKSTIINLVINSKRQSGFNIEGFFSNIQYEEFLQKHVENIFIDAWGYAGIEILRRQLGGVGTQEIKELPLNERVSIKTKLICMARYFLLNREKIQLVELPLIFERF